MSYNSSSCVTFVSCSCSEPGPAFILPGCYACRQRRHITQATLVLHDVAFDTSGVIVSKVVNTGATLGVRYQTHAGSKAIYCQT